MSEREGGGKGREREGGCVCGGDYDAAVLHVRFCVFGCVLVCVLVCVYVCMHACLRE